ncbi:transmembrane emp24 domain-containing protein 3-like isoform X2 [Polyodon spathula]|uniref:transmembrane emp24 domain-containing protein 3-like isoform X2 n=1 Tax=Polyodon spathula TaxID=7913 RepID=UPI001B7EAE58|nr:transmembrane emp24 domain-containing protein 3-like isoform X2 [Polyodon spathula]
MSVIQWAALLSVQEKTNSVVITGGNYDVDCSIVDPGAKVLYEESKKQYDHFSHTAEKTGVYKVCFSNEFSTFSHKTVYFDLQTREEPALIPEMHNRVSALTQMESSSVLIHEILKTISESQTHYRLREAIDRIRAEEIHEHVMYWSVGETLILFVVSISQVVMLKSFFTDKKSIPGLGF